MRMVREKDGYPKWHSAEVKLERNDMTPWVE